jgi:hypothetical protein
MKAGYYVEFRDFEHRANVYDEMRRAKGAFQTASKCEVCGGKKAHAKRHDNRFVVTCSDCRGKLPTSEQEAINRSHAEARARLAAMEKRSNEL